MMIALAVLLYLCATQCAVEATGNNYISPHIHHYQYAQPDLSLPYSVVAHFDINGIRGNVTFTQDNYYAPVCVTAKFDGLDQFGEDERWGWHVHDFPINFGQLEEFPCSTSSVGGHFDPDNRIDNANYTEDCSPEAPEECELGDLSGRFGHLSPSQSSYKFKSEDEDVNLYGPNSFVGRSIVLHRADGFRVACANIEYNGHNQLETFIARFPNDRFQQRNTLQGDVVLRRSAKRLGMSLMGLLFRVDGGPDETSHNWNLREGTCDSVSNNIWGPSMSDPATAKLTMDCSNIFHRHCPMGDLTSKCNPLTSDADGRIKFFCTDTQLSVIPQFDPIASDPRKPRLSLVIEEEAASGGGVLACSAFERLPEKSVRAMISQRVSYRSPAGRTRWLERTLDLQLYQRSPFDPTYIRLSFRNLPGANEFGEIPYIQIRERPVGSDGNCSNLGPVFEGRPYFDSSFPDIDGVIRTGERDFIGELRNKVPLTAVSTRRSSYLPLYGPFSVVGRSLVLHDSDGTVLGCGNLDEAIPSNLRLSLSGYYKKK